MNIATYLRTIYYLRSSQLFWQLWRRIYKPVLKLDEANFSKRCQEQNWTDSMFRKQQLTGQDCIRLLNFESEISSAACWQDTGKEILWLYHLHYLDFLSATTNPEEQEWQQKLLQRWIDENPPSAGIGWEAYPLSRRIVNIIKWSLQGNCLSQSQLDNLGLQTRALTQSLERHIGGNHLLANGKALCFSGLFFKGSEAEHWLNLGLKILTRQVPQQILADGGHFERSPMYHALVLEDLLDLLNLFKVYKFSPPGNLDLEQTATAMSNWLRVMSFTESRYALFNDCALQISLTLPELESYTKKLGIALPERKPGRLTCLKESGYYRLETNKAVLLIDAAPPGPDYLPAHGHADTLSFELCRRGKMFIVDSGTSLYQEGTERLRQRSTAAHNTVVIGSCNSSEVWKSFRCGRRAQVKVINHRETGDFLEVDASHNGYSHFKGSPVHRRCWQLSDSGLTLIDRITGTGIQAIELFLHLHPDLTLTSRDQFNFVCCQDNGKELANISFSAKLSVKEMAGTYHPEFGIKRHNRSFCAAFQGTIPIELVTKITWLD